MGQFRDATHQSPTQEVLQSQDVETQLVPTNIELQILSGSSTTMAAPNDDQLFPDEQEPDAEQLSEESKESDEEFKHNVPEEKDAKNTSKSFGIMFPSSRPAQEEREQHEDGEQVAQQYDSGDSDDEDIIIMLEDPTVTSASGFQSIRNANAHRRSVASNRSVA
ncbi:hypothetical protein ABW19_dt0209985 [Dactylella cylindrospora]|nr:hypothetical protein ABW19_dt0209985 [Dactylella cylindrospora]